MTAFRWGLVVPVKRLELAKSRLGGYGDEARQALALAFAVDVVAAGLRAASVVEVVVVTDDPRVCSAVAERGVRVLSDVPGAGLNPAVEYGASSLPVDWGVASVSADLPGLRAIHLDEALAGVRPGLRGFVPDHAGRGTTLLAAGPGAALGAAYGPDSRRVHLSSGAVELPAAAGLRLDVDTPEDLDVAQTLGVGPATAAALQVLQGPRGARSTGPVGA